MFSVFIIMAGIIFGMILYLGLKIINLTLTDPDYYSDLIARVVAFTLGLIAIPVLLIVLGILLYNIVPITQPAINIVGCKIDRLQYAMMYDSVDDPLYRTFVVYPSCDENLDLVILNEVCRYNLPSEDVMYTTTEQLNEYCPKGWDNDIRDTYLVKDEENPMLYKYDIEQARKMWQDRQK